MRQNRTSGSNVHGRPVKKRRGPLKRAWQTIREPLARSVLTTHLLPKAIAAYLRLTVRTNPLVEGSGHPINDFDVHAPAILALWHGQHIMIPALNPYTHRVVGMFSRSADAELNARVAEALGLGIVRGSGGRDGVDTRSKGGARALLALKKELAKGSSVAMIADVAKAEPRKSGLGIVMLARISGRPIVPVAYATNRRYVIDKSWDKTTINLPFGKGGLAIGEPVFVSREADDAMMEAKRAEVTDSLNAATERAYQLADGK